MSDDVERFSRRHVEGQPADFVLLDDPDHPIYDKPRKIVHRAEVNFWAFATIFVVLLVAVHIVERLIR